MKAPVALVMPAAAALVVLGVCLGAGITQGMSYSSPITSGEEPVVLVEETPTPTPTPTESALPEPTPTQEPVIVAPSPEPTPAEPEKGPSEPEPVIGEAERPVEWMPMDEGMLICGPDAKPAIDYNPHNGYGWWAYCEPALVQ